MQKTVDISVILVNYNTKELTKNCINSIYEKTNDVDFEIFVVDNNSTDGSCEMIEAEFQQVKLIKNSKNRGFGSANNIAIKQAQSKYILLLNTDTVLENNALKIFFDFMENTPDAIACGGCLYNAEGKSVHSYGHFFTPKTKILKTLQLSFLCKEEQEKINDKGNNENEEMKEVDLIIGADLFLRKSELDKSGAFDEDFFLYFEETELQYRLKKQSNQNKIFVLPDAKIKHLEGKSTKNRAKTRKYKLESEYLYYKKCFKIGKFNPFKLILMLSHLPRLFSHPIMILKVWKFILTN